MDNEIIEKKSLLSGSMSIKVESKKDSLNNQMVNNNNNLLVNKSRRHLITDDPGTATKYTDVPECKNIKPLDVLSTTSIDDSTFNNQQSKFKQFRPKSLSVGSLSITLVPNTKYTDAPKCEDVGPDDIRPITSTDDSTFNNQQSKFKQFCPKLSSNDSLSITLVPNTEYTDSCECEAIEPVDIIPTASIDDSTFNDELKFKEFCAEFLSNNSVSITLVPNTKVIYTPECKDIAPTDVLSITSTDDSMRNDQQLKFKQLFPKLSSNNSLSITLLPKKKSIGIPECKDIAPIDVLSTTSTNDSTFNSQQLKFKHFCPKVSSNNSLSVTLIPNMEYTDIPEYDNTELTNILSTTSTDFSMCNNQRAKLKQFLPTLSSNDSLSITLVPNTGYTDLLECDDIELCNIFSMTSADDSMFSNQQLLPKSLLNDITLEHNTTDESKKILNNEYTEIINSTVNLKSTELTNNVFKTVFVADADNSSTFVTEYSQTSSKKISNDILANSSLNMTLKPRIKQNEQLTAISSGEIVNSTVILKSTSKENTEPIGILPLTSANSCTLPPFFSIKSLQPNHDNNAITSSNCYMPKIMSSSEEESVKDTSDQLSSYTGIHQDFININ